MKILDVTLENFMSFGPAQTVPLSDLGLILVEGENRKSKSAGSNGAGKTNLPEGIVWTLFGKTTKGVAASDVVNNQTKKNCRGVVRLQGDDGIYVISRYRNHKEMGSNALTFEKRAESSETVNLSGVNLPATQEKITQFLGASFGLFCTSTYFSQANVRPFSLFTDKEIKQTFMEAMDLGRFNDALERVRDELKKLTPGVAKIEGFIARTKEDIEEAKSRLEKYERDHAGFASDKERVIKGIEGEITVRTSELEKLLGLAADIKKIAATIDTMRHEAGDIEDLQRNLEEARKRNHDFSVKFSMLQHKQRNLTDVVRRESSDLASVSKRIGTPCKECGKLIQEADVAGVMDALRIKIEELKKEADGVTAILIKGGLVHTANQKAEEAAVAAVKGKAAVKDKINELEKTLIALERDMARAPHFEKLIHDLQVKLEAERLRTSPFEHHIAETLKFIENARESLSKLEELHAKAQDEIKHLEFWANAFGYGGIPSFLLDGAVPFLNERSNHYAAISCDSEIAINFDTVTKGREKFAIHVEHIDGAKRYLGISGGERKRADVCIAQSIHYLSRSYGKRPLDLVFYDEPFEHLDAEGVTGVMEMLNEIAKEIGTVLVVTHDSEMKTLFERSIKVVKGEDGFSSIIM